MKTLIILFASLTLLAACGRKDAIFVSDKPAVAAKDGKPSEPVVNPRPVANRPAGKTFFLDGLL
jgi:predicted small lipoprotein YifL